MQTLNLKVSSKHSSTLRYPLMCDWCIWFFTYTSTFCMHQAAAITFSQLLFRDKQLHTLNQFYWMPKQFLWTIWQFSIHFFPLHYRFIRTVYLYISLMLLMLYEMSNEDDDTRAHRKRKAQYLPQHDGKIILCAVYT